MGSLTRSFALGLATGGRSSVSLTVPLAVAARGRTGAGAVLLRSVGRLAAIGELVADKLPVTPSRLGRPMLDARVLAGALGAAGLAVAERRPLRAVVVAAPVGAIGAFLGAHAGAAWRAWAADGGPSWLRPDARAALVEDSLVVGSAAVLVRSAHTKVA
ncbi:hypothetical protein [Cellulomonas edaphi]|uniref:DUF4126 domain-containing protein n=1 Tax=Cellulomonas edaphi TaxID=3053468 RepID=A0ABT7S6R5_9CELL|nr:hypothetical protein [Cellulomons edaphi]MDM7831313.1 hypothetical protein [Cellulomons edaphi]